MQTVIEIGNLTKSFKTFAKREGFWGSIESLFHRDYTTNHAVQDFTLSIEKGEILGLLGPNGAGKTTLMKMLTGIIVPSHGTLKVLGSVPADRDLQFRQKIALVMGQKSQLWWDIPAMDSFQLLKRFYEIPESQFQERVEMLGELLDVARLMHIHVRKLSLGERMKMELMACLLHSPEVLFLDEPTIGLDLIAQENIREFLLDYHRQFQPTIILTSHYMADVEALCERIVLILGGHKRFDGSRSEFSHILGSEKFVSFQFEKAVSPDCASFQDYDPHFSEDFTHVELRVPKDDLRAVSAKILQDHPVIDFHTEKLPIERVMGALLRNPELIHSERNSIQVD